MKRKVNLFKPFCGQWVGTSLHLPSELFIPDGPELNRGTHPAVPSFPGASMKVKDLMSRNVVSVTKEMSIRKLIKLMEERHITGAPVVDEAGRLIGIVSGRDIIAAIDYLLQVKLSLDEQQAHKGRYNWVEGIMSREVLTAQEDDDVRAVFKQMVERKIHRIPVVRDGKPVGIISSQDACRLVSGLGDL